MSALELKAVSSGYGDMHVLHGVSLVVQEGHCVAVLGRNGAGKTTLMRTISGLLPCKEGTVMVAGDAVDSKVSPAKIARMGIGHVQEGRRIFRRQSVMDNLLLGAYAVGLKSKADSRLQEVFDLFPALKAKQNDPAGLLSGGQQQMVAVGQALMAKPKVLLLDEPSAGLAPVLIDELFESLQRMRQEYGTTILLAEQYVGKALELADHAYVLEGGRVVTSGTSAEVSSDSQLADTYLGIAAE
jgi:branched-chain amino acid transport system ATP-binding protein